MLTAAGQSVPWVAGATVLGQIWVSDGATLSYLDLLRATDLPEILAEVVFRLISLPGRVI